MRDDYSFTFFYSSLRKNKRFWLEPQINNIQRILFHKLFNRFNVAGIVHFEFLNGLKGIARDWKFLQARLFKISIKGLVLEQTQTIGSSFINELKNIFITVFSAKLVIDGQITLGMMMAISYIIGQLNSPIQQLIGFIYSAQDTKIALERLS